MSRAALLAQIAGQEERRRQEPPGHPLGVPLA